MPLKTRRQRRPVYPELGWPHTASPICQRRSFGLPIALYIPAFYSQNLGLSLAAVGSLIALSRLTDVFTDPAIGIASDRWNTRFGRRKPWMVFGMPLMLLSLWMLFVPDSAFAVSLWRSVGGEAVTNLYLFVWISALYLSFTLVDLPYRAWGAELSADYDERSRVTGWREAFGYGGTLMALAIPLIAATFLDRPGADNALLAVALVVLVLLPLLTAPALLWVREVPAVAASKRVNVTWQRGLKIVWSNGPYRRLVISLLFLVASVSMTATLSFFFVSSVMEQPFDRYALFILAYYLSSSLAIPIWFAISRRVGKHKTVVLGVAWLVAVERVHSAAGTRRFLAVFCDHAAERVCRWRTGVPAGLHGRRRCRSRYSTHRRTAYRSVFLPVGYGQQGGSGVWRVPGHQRCRLVRF